MFVRRFIGGCVEYECAAGECAANLQSVYSFVLIVMVLCIVFGCSKRSGRDKDVHFYRIPKVVKNRGESTEKLSEKRRVGFLSAIKRADITDKILANDRICSRHFISGQPASLLDETNPDWLPTSYFQLGT